MIEVELHRISQNDLGEYLAFEKKVESRTYTSAQNREEAEEEFAQGPMYLIKQEDKVVGTVSYSIKEDGSVYINGLAIAPEHQGQGLGRAALEQILEQVKDAPRVWLVTHPENSRAIALYESFGFKVTDRIENFHGDGEPRVVLTREQTPH
jgi:ribosomal protein S18 acetylase RimI-like enzyme